MGPGFNEATSPWLTMLVKLTCLHVGLPIADILNSTWLYDIWKYDAPQKKKTLWW